MADNRSKSLLGGGTSKEAPKQLNRMTLEHTDNGQIKATHQFKGGGEPEIHAIPHDGVLNHLATFFGTSDASESAGITAKTKNVKDYEKVHGPLIPPVSSPKSEVPAVPTLNRYDKIREEIREKQKQPPASDESLTDRFNALTKSLPK